MASALEKLLHFMLERQDDGARAAVDAWFAGSERTVAEWETTSFLGYLAYGHTDAHGDRTIDWFLRERSNALSRAEHEALRAIQQRAWVSLFEILAASPNVGLDLLDRVTGRSVFVREQAGTHDASEGDYLLGWVVPLLDHAELTGAVCSVPAAHIAVVEAAIAAALGPDLHAGSDDSRHARLRAALPDVHRQLRDAIRNWKPRAFGPAGEEILICRAIYEATDTEAIRSRLAACPELVLAGETRFLWCRPAKGSTGDELDLLGEVELRTVRLSLLTPSRSLIEEGKRLLARLLGSLVRHRVDRVEDFTGQPVGRDRGTQPAPLSAGIPPRMALARDVDSVIADFNRQVGARVIAAVASPATTSTAPPGAPPARAVGPPARSPGCAASEASGGRTPDRIPSIDPKASVHRLPPLAHEVLSARVPHLGPLVREVAAALRKRAGWESLTLSPPELDEIAAVPDFLYAHALSRYRAGWSEEAAAAEANVLGAHLRSLVNFELHGRKIFWVDEALAWMLSETELDIVGRCLRLPFPACAFVFTDPGALELGESLLSLESNCPIRDAPLRILTAYVTRGAPAAEGEPQDLNVSFLFNAQSGPWPYLV
ncbi:MAG: hypothetical protein HYY95_03300, partial [Candidatus Rokubacteria bacterium]|nr:hypothetical protein [Candidatus Rokubacteria bacterium]